MSPPVYNPLDYDNLTLNVVETMMKRTPVPLSDLQEFEGAGVYALFYVGDLDIYQRVRSADAKIPIYVGKAVPPGARKGQVSVANDRSLFKRLMEHRKSLVAVDNLSPDQFLCRYLAVTPVWIGMAERFLIEHFQPPWNSCLDGFGLHDPGSGRTPKRSAWDTLHVGRAEGWKATLKDHKTPAEVVAELEAFLDDHLLLGG